MAPVSLKPTQKGVTALIVVAAVVFVCCLLSCFWAVGKSNRVNAERAKVEKEVRDSQAMAQTQRDSENKYLDTRAQIHCLESSVATQAYVPTLLKQIEHLGKSVDMKVIGVRPKAPNPNAGLAKKVASQSAGTGAAGQAPADPNAVAEKPEIPKPYDELEIDLELEGSYMNAVDFLYKLTSFPKIMAVNTIQMNPDNTPGLAMTESPLLNIKINVTAFVFKEASPSKKKPATGTANLPTDRGANSLTLAPQSGRVRHDGNENALHSPRRSGNEAG